MVDTIKDCAIEIDLVDDLPDGPAPVLVRTDIYISARHVVQLKALKPYLSLLRGQEVESVSDMLGHCVGIGLASLLADWEVGGGTLTFHAPPKAS